jgi:hypothetical protein
VAGNTQRVLVSAAALLFGLVAVVGVVAWLGSGGSGSPVQRGLTLGAATSNPPPPPSGALVLAKEAGSLAVAIAVQPGRVTASVLSPSGGAAAKLQLRFRVGGTTFASHSCGLGCYRAAVPSSRTLEVLVPGRRVTFRLPAARTPARGIVSRATRVFRSLHTLVYTEALRSDPKHGILTTWTLGAPNRASYRIQGGADAVIIGRRRWDRVNAHARWVRGTQIPPLAIPQPSWGSDFTNAYVLGTARIAGRPVWVVSFVNAAIPAWFTAWIDRKSYRTVQLRMTAAAHFMFHRYLEFDRPVSIEPPSSSRSS